MKGIGANSGIWGNTAAAFLFMLLGDQSARLSKGELVIAIDEGHVPLRAFEEQYVECPCRLRRVDHARETTYEVL